MGIALGVGHAWTERRLHRREARDVVERVEETGADAGEHGRATAVITSVARQTDRGPGWTASYGVRNDTAHWALTRGPETDGRWMVCGDSFEQFGVWHIGRTVKWLRGSKAQALAAVDSIRRARGLELVQ